MSDFSDSCKKISGQFKEADKREFDKQVQKLMQTRNWNYGQAVWYLTFEEAK